MLFRSLLMCALAVPFVHAAKVRWIDWQASTANGVDGRLAIGHTAVNVTYTGDYAFVQTTNNIGTDYWTEGNPAPYTSATVDNRPPCCDIIALNSQTTRSLQFSHSVDNLLFAFVSLNGNGYTFDRDFEIVSEGQGYWGDGTVEKVVDGNGYHLNGIAGEPHGVIRFLGSYDSITWTSQTAENWNGFTVGTFGLAPAPVPEPSTFGLAIGALALIPVLRRRR